MLISINTDRSLTRARRLLHILLLLSDCLLQQCTDFRRSIHKELGSLGAALDQAFRQPWPFIRLGPARSSAFPFLGPTTPTLSLSTLFRMNRKYKNMFVVVAARNGTHLSSLLFAAFADNHSI
jgi:hypothetical protein